MSGGEREGQACDSGRSPGCCGGAAGQGGQAGKSRRGFLEVVGLGAVAAFSSGWTPRIAAGPFQAGDFTALVPADKKLDAAWLASLTARGEPTIYRGDALGRIGMPVGGICAGQVYLGGDGRLWHWDIFNRVENSGTGGPHYEFPMEPRSPMWQGFAVELAGPGGEPSRRALDRTGWSDVTFRGEYPIGRVDYADPEVPLRMELEAFSPFVPLDVAASSLPATVLRYTLRNPGTAVVEGRLLGWLENPVGLEARERREVVRTNHVVREPGLLALDCAAAEPPAAAPATRADVVFDDFERETYERWTAEGTAFGTGPIAIASMPAYQGDVAGVGQRVVNTHAQAPGEGVEQRDAATGTLTSRPFRVERRFIRMLVGGGGHEGKTCVQLVVDGQVARQASGRNDNRMQPVVWNVARWEGQEAQLRMVDAVSGPWGNIGLDQVVFTDRPEAATGPLGREPDVGTLVLGLLEPAPGDVAAADLELGDGASRPVFPTIPGAPGAGGTASSSGVPLVGGLARSFRLEPGGETTITFVVAWHFPNLAISPAHGMTGRHYAGSFDNALAVARHVAGRIEPLTAATRLWRDTWYDSTLPYWFLDRTFLNTSILASSTCYRFGDGRFYGWEGVGCCAGTCGHVWSYAHAVARLFPELERETRERVDLGKALQADGAIWFRGEFNNFPAVDGQAGTILRVLREHQMSADGAWLRRVWPGVKRATEWLIAKDGDGDGLITTNQHNTLDTDWFGPVAWLSGLYLAALGAAETMAVAVGDAPFAAQCRKIRETGSKRLVAELFEGEYFVNRPDPAHLDAINSGTGCHIDQVMGQSWAFQVGLDRVLPEAETRQALRALWRYNFTPDVGPYRKAYRPGRWYAMPGEAGLLMCTFPRRGWDYDQAKGKGPDFAAGYFNECMNGFEYQVAGHMIAEGLVTEGLAVTRAVHDRYEASRRNPWNEIECGDHYARSMASYGVFLAACGYRHDGPAGVLGFAPRVAADDFRTAFTAAEGWGQYRQRRDGAALNAAVAVRWGRLRLETLELELADGARATRATARVDGRDVPARLEADGRRVRVRFDPEIVLPAGSALEVAVA